MDDRELYRFITEELFFKETDDMMMAGMTLHFIYEEFHPNHEHDIKSRCNEFVNVLLDKERDPSYLALTDEISSDNGTIKKEEALKKLETFRDAFDSFNLQAFEITLLKITKDTADVSFDINYTGIIEGCNEKKEFTGTGTFKLKCEYDYWCISEINVPGVPITK